MKKLFMLDKAHVVLPALALTLIGILSCIAIILKINAPDSYKIVNLSEGWVDENGRSFALNSFSTQGEDTPIPQRVYYTLSATDKNSSLLFRSRNMFVDVYVDGELVSKDKSEQPVMYGTSPGSRWHIITLDSSKTPVTICIEGTACYSNSHGLIDNIYLGTAKDVYRRITTERIPGFILSTFLHIIGVILLFLYTYLRKRFQIGKDLLYLGTATFFSAQWASAESLLWQLFFGYSEVFHLLGYYSLIAIPVPFGLLSAYRLKSRGINLYARIYTIVACINLFIATSLHTLGIIEYHYSLRFTHVLVVIMLPLLVMLVLSYTTNIPGRHNNALVYLALVILSLCLITAIVKYYNGQYTNYTIYVRIAIIAFLFCLITYQLSQMASLFAKGLKADMMHTLALTDYMTGLYNRTAFAEHKRAYIEMVVHNTPFGVIQFDINNLKTTNDTLGHEKGDQLLMLAADGIKESFGEAGKCYRMGGDEFLVILDGSNPQTDYDNGIRNLNNYCDNINQTLNLDFILQIAHGFVLNQGKVLEDSMEEADSKMYENKRSLKNMSMKP